MGAAEDLAGNLEGRQSNLSVLLVELSHDCAVQVVNGVIGHPRRRGRDSRRVVPSVRRGTKICSVC